MKQHCTVHFIAAALVAVILAGLAVLQGAPLAADQAPPENLGPGEIAGRVLGPDTYVSAAWVIVESQDLPTRLRKIVVATEEGYFLVPDLPPGRYKVWARCYGHRDSPPLDAKTGETVNPVLSEASDPVEGAKLLPASYWYALAEPPVRGEFPGTGPAGNGVSAEMSAEELWIDGMKQGCVACHQMGTSVTRLAGTAAAGHDAAAWDRRVQSGQRGAEMSAAMSRFGRERALKMFADWSSRIAAGETPSQPPRPLGIEQNVVITLWDWADQTASVRGGAATDRRSPTINGGGPVYGMSVSSDMLEILDPAANTVRRVPTPLADASALVPAAFPASAPQPSPFWGAQAIWKNPAAPRHAAMDGAGRVWITQYVRGLQKPDFCGKGSSHPSAKNFPLDQIGGGRQLSVFDPKTGQFTPVDTCFPTDQLVFARNTDNTLWLSARQAGVVGWVNTHLLDETHDPKAAQGWCPTILDTSGDGAIGAFTEPGQPQNPRLDRRVEVDGGALAVSQTDGSVWWASSSPFPGALLRLDPGTSPPASCRTEMYAPPFRNPAAPNVDGFTPRGIDIDRQGVVWTALTGSGHLASFDRRKCKVTSGPNATGAHCAEGWSLYPTPGPQLKGVSGLGTSDFYETLWIDHADTLGLGPDVVVVTGTGSDALLVFLPKTRDWLVFRVPAPLGFAPRRVDGRIDNPSGGWKGRGWWMSSGSDAPWHMEGGKGARPMVAHVQLRPDPLAR